MCVTNFVKRNAQPLGIAANTAALSKTPSLISQRLHGNFLPLLVNNSPVAKPTSRPAFNNVNKLPSSSSAHGLFLQEDQKSKPKRRRRAPQKPGLTAKKNERHFVQHNYHDHAFETYDCDVDDDGMGKSRKTTTSQTFPVKFLWVLERVEADGLSHIVSWQSHGRCFVIHKPKEFSEIVLPTYLRQGKLTSFQRQLNLYGFQRLTKGQDAGAYYHELFLRGKISLAKRMKRTKIKGTKFKAASSPDLEPDFYTMPPVVTLPQVSDESSSDSDSEMNDRNYSIQTQSAGLQVNQFHSPVSFEPIPLPVPGPQIFHTPIQPYPMLSVANSSNSSSSMVSTGMVTSGLSSTPTMNWGGNPMKNTITSLSKNMIGGFNAAFPTMAENASQSLPFAADSVLDDAVDELFNSANSVEENVSNLDDLWDPATFGETDDVVRIENDLQLGNLLETFLEQS